jgi:hypothetical protein
MIELQAIYQNIIQLNESEIEINDKKTATNICYQY